MNKQTTIYVVLLVILVGTIIAIDASKPKPVNWSPSYNIKDKIPFGLYIFDREIDDLFKNDTVEKFNITPYEFFDDHYDYDINDYTIKGSIINISSKNTMDEESVRELMYFAEYGNTVFLSMNEFPSAILDTLKIEMGNNYFYNDSLPIYLSKNRKEKFYYKTGINYSFFESVDTLKTTVLGYHDFFKKQETNFIKVKYGNGTFLLHSQPVVFTNYHLLKGNHYQYTEKVLSHLPEGNVYWNTGSNYNERLSGSPLRYILSKDGLRNAYYFGLLALLIFIIFNAKRKQRIMKEIAPVRNTTIDFAKTIGNLYHQEGDHHTIADKKIIYFLEKIRTDYMIDTHNLDDAFVEKLHVKTGKPIEDIKSAVYLIKKHRQWPTTTEADLVAINKAIEKLRL